MGFQHWSQTNTHCFLGHTHRQNNTHTYTPSGFAQATAHSRADGSRSMATQASVYIWQPRTMSSSELFSSKAWLMPPIDGMNSMLEGMTFARTAASCPAAVPKAT